MAGITRNLARDKSSLADWMTFVVLALGAFFSMVCAIGAWYAWTVVNAHATEQNVSDIAALKADVRVINDRTIRMETTLDLLKQRSDRHSHR